MNTMMDKRGFDSVEAMNEHMILRWNRKVRKNDEVVILGDFSVERGEKTNEILKRLNGRKYLITGNHDKFLGDKNFNTNLFKENELKRESNVQKMHIANADRPVAYYSLDVIISVGYRVKSQRGVEFRRWANSVLKQYILQGYAINERRLQAVNEYTQALTLLDQYDHQSLDKPKGNEPVYRITYKECRAMIDKMEDSFKSSVFGVEKENGKVEGIIAAVYQEVFGTELYPSIEEKASNLLYFMIKDHPFADGCKRIGASLFLEFLNKNNALYRNGIKIISNGALVAITLMIAESNPTEKDYYAWVKEIGDRFLKSQVRAVTNLHYMKWYCELYSIENNLPQPGGDSMDELNSLLHEDANLYRWKQESNDYFYKSLYDSERSGIAGCARKHCQR